MINKTTFFTTLSLVSAASLAVLLSPASAIALSFGWSFVVGPGSSGEFGQTISGTISGLVEGSNSGNGLTVTVDATPTGALLGDNWSFVDTALGVDAFTVTNEVVTFADAKFTRLVAENTEELYFGGFGGYTPQLINSTNGGDPNWLNDNTPTCFTSVCVVATPEPSGVVALFGLGVLGLAGRKLKK